MPSVGALSLLLALMVTWRQQYDKIIHRPLNWVLAILASWLVLTSSFAFNPLDAWLGLFNFLPFFGIFAAFSVLIQTPAQLRQLANILVMTSLPVVIIGLGQLFWGWASPVGWQGVLGWLGCAIAPLGNPPSRMASVFMYANILAGYLVIVFILALGLWIEAFQGTGDRRKPKVKRSQRPAGAFRRAVASTEETSATQCPPVEATGVQKSKVKNAPHSSLGSRLFLTVAVVANLVALILTYSRNAWAIAVFACIALAVYQGWYWLVAGVSAIASSVFWAAFGPSPVQQCLRQVIPSYFWQRLTDQMYPNRPVMLLRKTQWQVTWELTQQRPWTGWGLRNFSPLYESQMHVWLGHPHNLFLMLTAEIGIPAAGVFCGWIIWVVYQGIQLLFNWSSISTKGDRQDSQERLIFFTYLVAFCACMLFNTVDVTIFDLRLNTLVWLLLSAICGVIYHQREAVYSKHR
jgi:hypothetical protein